MSSTAEMIAPDLVTRSENAAAGGLRLAHYSVYPRAERDHGVRAGYTRAARQGVLQLVTTAPQQVGELLRIRIHGLGEREPRDRLARVLACRQLADARFELSLEELDALAPRKVRRRDAS